MCGRYTLVQSKEKLTQRFKASFAEEFKPRYNIAPTQKSAIICNDQPKEIKLFRWGLIPNWAVNPETGANLINARAETILTKAPFKEIIKSKRCLIPADGFYEWKKEGKLKIPHRITLATDEIFSFAGVWDVWEDYDGNQVGTFSIITTTANSTIRDIHDRMPVILPIHLEDQWLDEKLSEKAIQELLIPYPADKISYYKAHRAVNSAEYDLPECIQAAPKIYPGETYSLFDS